MKTEKTINGWVDTIITTNVIKIAKKIQKVKSWNAFNGKNPDIGKSRLHCNRCKTLWTAIPEDQHIVICMMERGINMCICEECLSEIDQSLVIKEKPSYRCWNCNNQYDYEATANSCPKCGLLKGEPIDL